MKDERAGYRTEWKKTVLEWEPEGEDRVVCLSIPFTWQLQEAHQRAVWWGMLGYRVRAGGPAVNLMPHVLSNVAEVGGDIEDVVARFNPFATFTSRGCVWSCSFCPVPKAEGELVELEKWPIRPIVCDNNLVACSRKHFDRVVDSLKSLRGIDFNQGLDARLLTKYHAGRLAELDCLARLAFDHISCESSFMRAYELLRAEGFPKRRIAVYVLIGFRDSPEDALYRLRAVRGLGVKPFPMRYQPIDTMQKNSYVAEGWTAGELARMMKYWSRLRYTEHVPYEVWGRKGKAQKLEARL